MGSRLELQDELQTLLESSNVYFQPPESMKIQYPCIIYKLDRVRTKHANNELYNHVKAYQITIIDRDPDSDIPGRILEFPMARFDRFYTAEQLNHFVYTVFF